MSRISATLKKSRPLEPQAVTERKSLIERGMAEARERMQQARYEVSETMEAVSDEMRDKLERAERRAREEYRIARRSYRRARRQLRRAGRSWNARVDEHPYRSLAVAAGFGFVLGVIAAAGRGHRPELEECREE